jgi:hypothetical protein
MHNVKKLGKASLKENKWNVLDIACHETLIVWPIASRQANVGLARDAGFPRERQCAMLGDATSSDPQETFDL